MGSQSLRWAGEETPLVEGRVSGTWGAGCGEITRLGFPFRLEENDKGTNMDPTGMSHGLCMCVT